MREMRERERERERESEKINDKMRKEESIIVNRLISLYKRQEGNTRRELSLYSNMNLAEERGLQTGNQNFSDLRTK